MPWTLSSQSLLGRLEYITVGAGRRDILVWLPSFFLLVVDGGGDKRVTLILL